MTMYALHSTVSLFQTGTTSKAIVKNDDHARYHLYFVLDCQTEAGLNVLNFLVNEIDGLHKRLDQSTDCSTLLRPYEIIRECFNSIVGHKTALIGCCSYAGAILDRQEMQLYLVNLGNVRCMVYNDKSLNNKAQEIVSTRPHSTNDSQERRLCEANGFTLIKKPHEPYTLYGSQVTRIFGESGVSPLLDKARQILGMVPDFGVCDLSPYYKKSFMSVQCLLSTSIVFDQISPESILRSKILRTATPSQLGLFLKNVLVSDDRMPLALTIMKLSFMIS